MSEDPRVVLERVQIADRRWTKALEASEMAAPNAGFASRVREIADACEQQAAALEQAHARGLGWTPAPAARTMHLSYELRPGANRPGPPARWREFDAAVAGLGETMEGVAISAVARSFGALSQLARELANELEQGKRRGRRAG